jgi:hypothetical protein
VLVLAFTAVAGVGAVVAWIIDRRRCRRRNEEGACGACGSSWAETPLGERYLIHGRLVCENCAAKAKHRMLWELGALAGWVALATGVTLGGEGLALLVFIPTGMGIATVGAVQLMKLENRNAQKRIAKGEFPGFDALETERRADSTPVLSNGLSRNPDG